MSLLLSRICFNSIATAMGICWDKRSSGACPSGSIDVNVHPCLEEELVYDEEDISLHTTEYTTSTTTQGTQGPSVHGNGTSRYTK